MLNRFITYYQKKELFKADDKILLAVSGGKDSIAMATLFLQAKLNIGIAHCNFQLRGKDAELDQKFVKRWTDENGIPFYSTDFNTKEYATNHGVSIQMAARELRYNWFEKIRHENNYKYIATAHHKNDVAETLLINLTKGTGIAGLHGISQKKGKIIRPLLGFTRNEITAFLEEFKIDYREDLSNADTKYTRNKIRHKVLPELAQINPRIIEILNTDAEHFSGVEQIVIQKIEEVKSECFSYENDAINIDIAKLVSLKPLKTYLYYFLKDFGFNSADVDDIIVGLFNHSGKIYTSSSHQLLKDRDYLVVTSNANLKSKTYSIKTIEDFNKLPIRLDVNVQMKSTDFQLKKNLAFAYLDYTKIQFPLTLRKWKKGDAFQPLGMRGKKKLSDFFIDEKLSLNQKNDVWLLLSNTNIIWVIGFRIDDNYKITSDTKKILQISLIN